MGIVKSAGLLYAAGLFHAGANLRRGGDDSLTAQLLEGDGRDFDMDIDTVEQRWQERSEPSRPADFIQVLLDLPGCAAALSRGIAQKSAVTCVI